MVSGGYFERLQLEKRARTLSPPQNNRLALECFRGLRNSFPSASFTFSITFSLSQSIQDLIPRLFLLHENLLYPTAP
jgi:hypothetical protein